MFLLMMMCKKPILIIVILHGFLLTFSNSKCKCGYGSYCDVVATNCLCAEISRGLYVTPESPTAECSEIKNHCLSSPCKNGGVCHPAFGSFYCVCKQGYHGHICNKYSDTKGVGFVKNVMVYYDIHEYELGEGITFLVIIKEFGNNFNIEVDDGNGHSMDNSFIEFKTLNPYEICESISTKAEEADPKICEYVPNADLNVAEIILKYPHDYRDANLVYDGKIIMGRKEYVRVTVMNNNEVEFSQSYPIFTTLDITGHECILAIQLDYCSNNSRTPAKYTRERIFVIKSSTYPINKKCKYITDFHHTWHVSGKAYNYKFRGLAHRKFVGQKLLPGLYTVELSVEIHGSYNPGDPKETYRNVKKCWFEIGWEKLVPIIIGGTRRAVTENTKVKLDASLSYDPNFEENKRLRYTWYCKTDHYFCKARTQRESVHEIPGMDAGTYEMFLNLSSSIHGVPISEASQIIEVIKGHVIEGFELICLNNCVKTVAFELTLLQLKFIPPGKTVVWTIRKDGGEEKEANSIRLADTPEDIFIIRKGVLVPGSEYIMKAKVDVTYNEIKLTVVKPPEKGQCKITPDTGTKGYTLFDVFCSGYKSSVPESILIYEVYQKIVKITSDPNQNLEWSLVSSTQIPVAIDLQFVAEQIQIKISNFFGDYLTEYHTIKLTEQNFDRTELDNLVYKVQDNIRNSEVQKGVSSLYIIADHLKNVPEISKVVDVLVQSLKKIHIVVPADAKQVVHGLHFLFKKCADIDSNLLLSNTVTTTAFIISSIADNRKAMLRRYEYADIESDLIDISRNVLGIVDVLIHNRDNYLTDKSADVEKSQQSYDNYQKASAKILSAVNGVSSMLLNKMVLSQKPIMIENKFIVTKLVADRMDRISQYNIDPSAGGNAYLKFDENFAASRGIDAEVQITEFKENLFWWLQSEYTMNSEHLNVELKLRNVKSQESVLEHPVHIFMQTSHLTTEKVTGVVEQPSSSLSLEKKDLYVKVFKLARLRGTGSKLFVEFYDLGTDELDVIIIVDAYPDYDIVKKRGKTISIGHNWYESDSLTNLKSDSIIYLGIIPGIKHISGHNITFEFEVHDQLCRVWAGEEDWDISSCEVAPDSNLTLVHCLCKHLSMFGASVLVPPNMVHPFKDIYLILTIQDNPYVFGFVIFFLLIYCGLFIWAWRMDKKDSHERQVRLLIDNFPGESYGYLLAVFTGEKTLSGTSANVGVKIYGSDGSSHAHILNHEKDTLQLAQDNWFLIFAANHLGNIEYLHVWHDNTGASPDWNCNKIILYDLSTNDKYTFIVDKWLSVSTVDNNWKLEWILLPGKPEETEWQNLARENFFIGLRESHLWISIFVRHPRTAYTRRQRLTVAMCIIMVSMLLALMFYGAAEKEAADDPTYSITTREMVVAIQCALISFPISIIVACLFKRGRQPAKKPLAVSQAGRKEKRSFLEIFSNLLKNFLTLDPLMPVELIDEEAPAEEKYIKKKKRLLISAWVVSFVIIFLCSFFLILYGLKLGANKSVSWISVTLLRLGWAIFIAQPVKVIVYALLFTFIFKESHRNQLLFSVENKGIDAKFKDNIEYMSKLMELRSKPMYNPLNELDVMMLSKKRKKNEQQTWSVINLIFVTVMYISLCILVSGSHSSTSYYHTEHLLDLIKTPQTATDFDVDEVYNKSRFFEYVLKSLLPSLHNTDWYNGKDLPLETEEAGVTRDFWRGWTSDYSNKLLGVPRLRQLRIKKETCSVPKDFQHYFKQCNSSFSTSIQDMEDYKKGWNDPTFNGSEQIWNYSTPDISETMGMYGISGYFYPGGGYIRNLSTNLHASSKEIVKLKLENWFDELTRTIFFEFNLYNVFSNYFSQVSIVVENLASGVIGTRVYIETGYHQFYLHTLDMRFLIALIFFIMVLILSVLRVVIHVSVQGIRSFLNSHENLFDLLIIFFGFSSVIAYVVRVGYFKVYSDAYEKTDNESYISFTYPFYQDDLGGVLICILVVITTIRLFQLAQYGKYFYILRNTIKESRPYIISTFVLVLFFTFLISMVCFISGAQHSNMFQILLEPKTDFINYQQSYKLTQNEIYFKITINLIYYFAVMFIIAVFIFFYAKSKFQFITIGRVEGYPNHFLHLYNSFLKGWDSLIKDDIEMRIQQGTATREEKILYRRKLYAAAKERVARDFKLKKFEAEDIMKDFVSVSKRHKKMCLQLDKLLELIE